MLGDGARALRLERDRTPRALPDVFCLREGPPVSQVDPAMPSESDQAKIGLQGSVQAKNSRFPRWVDERVCKTAKVGGQIIFRSMKAIATKKPRAFLLENVKGLLSCHPETLRMISGRLRAIGVGIYDVGHRVLDTAKHGLPQHRERVFIIGIRIRNSHRKGRPEFRWPRPVACRPLARLLDPLPVGSDVREADGNFLATCSPGQKKRLFFAGILENGSNRAGRPLR